MSPDSANSESTARSGDSDSPREPARVVLFMRHGRNRDLLVETLGEQYDVETTTEAEILQTDFDCCILDKYHLSRAADTIESRRDDDGVFLPFVLLVEGDSADAANPDVWEYVDDVVHIPVKKAELTSRICNLVERRQTAVELAEREAQLAETVENLRLKEQAIDEAPVGFTITDPARDDNPIIYANEQFKELTGYDESEILGRNCRFLQGAETSPQTRAEVREAVDSAEPASVDIVNYRKNGQKFWNKLDVSPVRDENGDVRNYVGFQADITDRKIRERRLEVLNRVLSHNMRNKMNVIEGHITLVRDDDLSEQATRSLHEMEETAADLMGLLDTVREIERTLTETGTTVISLDERLKQIVYAFEDRFPGATFRLDLPDESLDVAVTGLGSAVEEAIANAVKHNDSDVPVVEIRVAKRDEEWIDIDVEDNGPGIPDQEIAVLERGETPLSHADRLGLWMIYWVVNKAGGRFSVSDADPRGTVLSLSVPAYEGDADEAGTEADGTDG